MKYVSKALELNKITFPEFNNERIYMLPFYKKKGLPKNLSHWQKTINQMLENVETEDVIYLMIDQSFVKANTTQRRPGLHIDGYWNPKNLSDLENAILSGSHGSHGGHKPNFFSGTHGGHGSHKPKIFSGSHGQGSGHKSKSQLDFNNTLNQDNWSHSSFREHEAILLASNISASRGFIGNFEGPIGDMGACEHIETSELKEIILSENKVYAGNVTFLHESLPVKENSYRTLVRLNVPGFSF